MSPAPVSAIRHTLSAVLALFIAGLAALAACPAAADHISAVPGPSATAPAAEHWLKARGDEAYPPYEFLDNNGVAQGFNVDTLLASARAMGLLVEIDLGPWSQVRSELEQGDIDIITGMFYSPQRAELVDFSQPFIEVTYAIFVRRGSAISRLEQLRGHTLAVQEGDIADDYVETHDYGATIIRVPNPAAALRMVAEGKCDCALLPRLLGSYIARKADLESIKAVGRPLLPRQYCFAVRKGQHQLVSQLNEGLSLIRQNGEYEQIYEKWFGPAEDKGSWAEAGVYLLMIIVPLAVLLLLMLAWSWSLRRRVAQKTNELVHELAQRKVVESRLADRERHLQTLFDGLPDGIATLDKDRRITECNKAFLEMFGYTSDEIIGMPTTVTHLSQDHFERFGSLVYPIIKSQGYWHGDWEFKRKDGSFLPIDLILTTIRGPFGELLGYLAVMRDITRQLKAEEERRALEQQLRQVQKMEAVGTLAGGIAHDFNNILGAIMGYTELAIWDAQEGRDNRDKLQKTIQAAQRAKALVRQVLAFSRQMEPNMAPTDMAQVIEGAVDMLRRTLPRLVQISADVPENLPQISGDATLLEQLIINLGSNARDAMPGGGMFKILCRQVEMPPARAEALGLRPGPYLHLAFSDNGEGMDEATMAHVFDPFFSTKEVGKGTGLGLSMAFGVAKSHGGAITCDSARGRGTTFDLYLPVSAGSPGGDEPEEAPAPQGEARGGLIILVDDEPDLLAVGSAILEREGFRVITAENGRAALFELERNPEAALVVADVDMPEMDGRQLLARLRELHPKLPVLICSGFGKGPDREGLAHARGFVSKPFRAEELVQKIRRTLHSA